jgi:hypothetical protein
MRGQVSFEFVVVITVVLLLSAIIASDAFNEANSTFALAGAKTAALSEIAKLGCAGSYLKSAMLTSGKTILLEVGGVCRPTASSIADYVEEKICKATPNHDSWVTCGGDTYFIMVA